MSGGKAFFKIFFKILIFPNKFPMIGLKVIH